MVEPHLISHGKKTQLGGGMMAEISDAEKLEVAINKLQAMLNDARKATNEYSARHDANRLYGALSDIRHDLGFLLEWLKM